MKKTDLFKLSGLSLSMLLAFGLSGSPAMADVDKLVKECADCHGKDGNSTEVESPSIAGMSQTYFVDSMTMYKSNTRPALKLKDKKEDMKDVVKKLSDDDIKALAAHFAKQKFKPFKQEFDPALAKVGKELHKKYCDKCHSAGGSSAEDDAGILAGQPAAYLKYTMNNFKDEKREMGKKMAKKFNAMTKEAGDESIVQLVHYYASQQ